MSYIKTRSALSLTRGFVARYKAELLIAPGQVDKYDQPITAELSFPADEHTGLLQPAYCVGLVDPHLIAYFHPKMGSLSDTGKWRILDKATYTYPNQKAFDELWDWALSIVQPFCEFLDRQALLLGRDYTIQEVLHGWPLPGDNPELRIARKIGKLRPIKLP